MRFGLLVGDCAQCIGQGDNFIFFNVANIIPSLKFRPTPTEFKENFYWFILCFRKFGAFSIFFLYPQDQKRVDFAIFWLLASRKEENFYLQVEKVDSGIPDLVV